MTNKKASKQDLMVFSIYTLGGGVGIESVNAFKPQLACDFEWSSERCLVGALELFHGVDESLNSLERHGVVGGGTETAH